MTHPASGNATWQDYPSTTTQISAASLENIEFALDLTKLTYRAVSANTTANNNEKLYVDASGGARVITAPTSPVTGTRLFVAATAATTTNTVTLNWTINGDTGGVQLRDAGAGVHLSYFATTGWFIDYVTTNAGKTGSSSAPSAAGFRNGYYSVPTTQYTPSPGALRAIRGAINKAAIGQLVNIVVMGDSRTAGYIQAGNTPSDAYPSRLRARLANLGIPSAGTGLVMCSNNATINDSRLTYTGTWDYQYPYRGWGASGSTATFTSDAAGSIVEVYYYSNSGTFTVKVGAGAAQSVTPAGGGTNVAVVQYTGQSVSIGTQIVLTATSAAGYLIGFCVRNAAGALVHSVAYGGATSSNLADNGATSLQKIVTYINPAILGVMIGCNDPSTGPVTSGTHAANLNTILSTNNPNPAKFLICESPTPGYEAAWPPYVVAQYDQADALNIPLIDLMSRWVSPALGTSAGLQGADGLHESVAGHEDIARNVARMLVS